MDFVLKRVIYISNWNRQKQVGAPTHVFLKKSKLFKNTYLIVYAHACVTGFVLRINVTIFRPKMYLFFASGLIGVVIFNSNTNRRFTTPAQVESKLSTRLFRAYRK